MKKRILALAAAALMVCGTLAGCASSSSSSSPSSSSSGTGSSSADNAGTKTITTSDGSYTFHEEGYPITDEKSTFTVLIATGVNDIAETPMMKEISEKTNVYPTWQVIAKTAVDERKALLWASNDYPDVIGPNILTKNDVVTYGPQGILIPLNEYYDRYMTYFNELVDDNLKAEITCYDGNIYQIPTVYDTERYDGQMFMPTKWLEALNLQVPTTVDEFYNCLVAIKNGDPNGNGDTTDEVPFAIGLWSSPFDYIKYFFSFFGNPAIYYVDDNGAVIDGRLGEGVREGAKFLQKCYAEGLLDQELFTQDLATFRAKAQTEAQTYGFMLGYLINYYVGLAHFEADEYDVMPLLEDANGVKRWAFGNSNASATLPQMAITTACQAPEIAMRWMNYMHDPLISSQINAAPIGIAFDYDSDGNLYSIENPAVEGYESLIAWRDLNNEQQFPRLNGSCIWDYMKENYGYVYKMSDSRKEAEAGVEAYAPYAVQEFPLVTATPDETEEENLYAADLQKYYEETVAGWITGSADIDAEWDAYVSYMKSLGAETVLAVKQKQSDRFFASTK